MTDNPVTPMQAETEQKKQILVAIDFSEDSRAALLWACQFANRTQSRLVILHVVHDPASSPGFYRLKGQDKLLSLQDIAESMMAEFLSETIEKHPDLDALQSADTKLVNGLPPGRIVEVADGLNAELIVIGSRGMTGMPHLMLGSVAERVVELASRPVVVVKAEGHSKKKKKKKKSKKEKKQ